MKIRKNYVLYINDMLGTAIYGNSEFGKRMQFATIGKLYDCSFSELKNNLYLLEEKGYIISQRNW